MVGQMTPAGNRISKLIAAAVMSTLVIGCGGGGSGRGATASVRPQVPLPAEPYVQQLASVGAYGGRFVLGQITAPRTFNPFVANEASSNDVIGRMFTGLASFDNGTQKDEPGLAKSWSVAEDKVTWTFNLRRGAQFSDGKPITSADVLFSFRIAYDDKVHPSVQDLLVMNGKRFEVTAPDDFTVVIKTPSPNAMLVSLASSVPIVPEARSRAFAQRRKLRVDVHGRHCRLVSS